MDWGNTGVAANYQPIPLQLWRYFDTQANDSTSLTAAQALSGMSTATLAVINNANFLKAGEFHLLARHTNSAPANTIFARVITGTATDTQGSMGIQESASDLTDRKVVPIEGVDNFRYGQTPSALKVRRVSPTAGQLYWSI